MLNNTLRKYGNYNTMKFFNIALQALDSSFTIKSIHTGLANCYCTGNNNDNLPAIRNPFTSATDKSKETFIKMVQIFEGRDIRRRNHVEFIYAALKSMAEFGVARDLEVYKSLVNVMPKGKFIPTNVFQTEFMHYPKQQQCIIDLLEQMEDYGVMPDIEMESMLLNIFGKRGYPLRKFWRMMYWMPKFKNLSPWLLPDPMPNDTLEIAKLAVERMCSVDLRSKVTVYETKLVKDAIDHTWIVSGMSEDQSQLLREHPTDKSLYIEGPFLIWMGRHNLHYFILRADPDAKVLESFKEPDAYEDDDVSKLSVPFFGKFPKKHKDQEAAKVRSVHQQDDGTILAICVTGTSTKDSLLSWVRLLEASNNPALGKIPIVFRFKSAIKEIIPIEASQGLKSSGSVSASSVTAGRSDDNDAHRGET